jgi:hypothetical protein
MEAEYIEGLKFIQHCRKTNVRNQRVIIFLMIVGAVVSVIFPPAFLLEALGAFLFWYSHIKTARVSCPRCEEAFGSSWLIPLGVGTNECANCKLSLNLLAQASGNAGKSHSKEWLE